MVLCRVSWVEVSEVMHGWRVIGWVGEISELVDGGGESGESRGAMT